MNLCSTATEIMAGEMIEINKDEVERHDNGDNDNRCVIDDILNGITRVGKQTRGVNLCFTCWKCTFWCSFVLMIFVGVTLLLLLYLLLNEIVSEDFVYKIGIYDVYTSGLSTQKSGINQMLTQTGFGYNAYTLTTIESSRNIFAKLSNTEVWNENKQELSRVDEFNQYYCAGVNEYLLKTKDITSENIIDDIHVSQIVVQNVDPPNRYDNIMSHIFNHNKNSYKSDDFQTFFESNWSYSLI